MHTPCMHTPYTHMHRHTQRHAHRYAHRHADTHACTHTINLLYVTAQHKCSYPHHSPVSNHTCPTRIKTMPTIQHTNVITIHTKAKQHIYPFTFKPQFSATHQIPTITDALHNIKHRKGHCLGAQSLGHSMFSKQTHRAAKLTYTYTLEPP